MGWNRKERFYRDKQKDHGYIAERLSTTIIMTLNKPFGFDPLIINSSMDH